MDESVAGEQRDTDPSARNGANGIAIFRAPEPCRAKRTTAGTSAAIIPSGSATATVRPSATPISSASLTSPMPIPPG